MTPKLRWRICRALSCLLLAALLLYACDEVPSPPEPTPPEPPTITAPSVQLTPTPFDDLENWQQDSQLEALQTFLRTCKYLSHKGAPRLGDYFNGAVNWPGVCSTAKKVATQNSGAEARRFFEDTFQAYRVSKQNDATGLFTGYFEIALEGSTVRQPGFETPIRHRPTDLIEARLGEFQKDLQGITLYGRVQGNRLTPYPDREELEAGFLDNRGLEFIWLRSATDKLFLQIQGSGRIRLTNGKEVRVGFDGKNGRPYGSVGKELIRRGELTLPQASMQGIRQWFAAHPEQEAEIMAANPSYVFFRQLEGEGPIGAAGVPLTPARSLAVDLRILPLGLPLWLNAEHPKQEPPLQRLMIAQDTGGAIQGVVRGDFYWGSGDDAGRLAGAMRSKGQYYLLVPRTLHLKPEQLPAATTATPSPAEGS